MDIRDRKPPFVPPGLIDYLNRLFPDRCPKETDTNDQVKIAIGARKVVDHLASLVARQSPDQVEIK